MSPTVSSRSLNALNCSPVAGAARAYSWQMIPHMVRKRAVLLIIAAALSAGTVAARRAGYAVGGNTIVRCRRGHLFTTLWIPGVSVKAIRLGWWRLQRCPIGPHWSIVSPVKGTNLTETERRLASQERDIRIP
ncbi:MAG: hypothetical protein ACRDZ5_04450 [Acidimicrobiales bacterium]